VTSDDLRITYVPQMPSDGLVPDLTIVENAMMHTIVLGRHGMRRAISTKAKRDLCDALDRLGLHFLVDKLDMPPTALSGGEQQLLNLIGAMYAQPHLILCDEPTSKLDEQNRIRICSLLVTAAQETHCSVICASHDHEIVQRVADRVVSLENGRVTSEVALRIPLSPRFVGDVRICGLRSNLPAYLQDVDSNWWRPGEGQLFDEAYFRGDDSAEGYLVSRPLLRNARTLREVEGILRVLGLSGKERIADIPCGWGRHSIELAKRGFAVKGIDLSEAYIEKARNAARQADLAMRMEVLCGDMRKLPLSNASCDVVLNLWTSFGFFSREDDKLVLKEFARILKPGGRVLVHSDLNPERVKLGIFDEPPVRNIVGGGALEVREYYCEEERAVFGFWKVDTLASQHTFRLNIYTIRDWSALARDAGFKVESTCGSLDNSASLLTMRSQEFVIVLRKDNL